jgi:hypothetical protein
MMALRKLSILAIAALLITGISGITHATGTTNAPTPTTTLSTTCLTNTSLTDLITCLINSVGDDAFSTIDLTTLVNPITLAAPTSFHTTTFAPMSHDSNSGSSTQHYGPYASGSPDSGTCGNNWANDSFDRHFTVFLNKNDGSFVVVEQFKDGNFTTVSGPSPGGCEPGSTPGTVIAGVTGSLHGYFVIPLPSGTKQTSFDSSCVSGSPTAPCTTTDFIDTHFTPCYGSGGCSAGTFFDHYVAPSQGLIENEWKNASADRGGNSGDIRSANL